MCIRTCGSNQWFQVNQKGKKCTYSTLTFRHNSRLSEISLSGLSILNSSKSYSFFVFDQQEEISVLENKKYYSYRVVLARLQNNGQSHFVNFLRYMGRFCIE